MGYVCNTTNYTIQISKIVIIKDKVHTTTRTFITQFKG